MKNYPEKCPYCGKDFASKETVRFYNGEKYYIEILECIHCRQTVLLVLNPDRTEVLHIFPADYHHDFQPELKELSPNACKVFEETLHANSIGLEYLVGPGIRISLEWLVWDYLTKFKQIPDVELKDKTLFQRLDYFKEDQYKAVCANILRIFGNETIHIFKNTDINIDEAIKILNILFNNIYAELFIQRVNSKL